VLLCEPSKDNFGLPVTAEPAGYQAQIRSPPSQLLAFKVMTCCLLQLLFSPLLQGCCLHTHIPHMTSKGCSGR
jgi:hypothetical protein